MNHLEITIKGKTVTPAFIRNLTDSLVEIKGEAVVSFEGHPEEWFTLTTRDSEGFAGALSIELKHLVRMFDYETDADMIADSSQNVIGTLRGFTNYVA